MESVYKIGLTGEELDEILSKGITMDEVNLVLEDAIATAIAQKY